MYITPSKIAVTPHSTTIPAKVNTVAGTVFLIAVDAQTPILPISNAATNTNTTNCNRSTKARPPMVNTMEITGKLETTNNNTILMDAISFPQTISDGFIVVVSKISNVCFSRSPAMLPAVKDGTRNPTITDSSTTSATYKPIAVP